MYALLSELSLHIYRKTYERIGFNVLNIKFSKIPLIFHDKIINFIILSMEQYSFSCVMLNELPTLISFIGYLKVLLNVEKMLQFKVHKF